MDDNQIAEQNQQMERLEDKLEQEEELILNLIADIESLDSLIAPEARHVVKTLRPITVSDDVYEEIEEKKSFADNLSDEIAKRAGSWSFIIGFVVFMAIWIGINVVLAEKAYDPYPFILLNLGLSTLAAIQAPVILMSQNRQSETDRAVAHNDYQVNLKAELEIADLHRKMDILISAFEHQNKRIDSIVSTAKIDDDSK